MKRRDFTKLLGTLPLIPYLFKSKGIVTLPKHTDKTERPLILTLGPSKFNKNFKGAYQIKKSNEEYFIVQQEVTSRYSRYEGDRAYPYVVDVFAFGGKTFKTKKEAEQHLIDKHGILYKQNVLDRYEYYKVV